jgi:ribonuclease HIII
LKDSERILKEKIHKTLTTKFEDSYNPEIKSVKESRNMFKIYHYYFYLIILEKKLIEESTINWDSSSKVEKLKNYRKIKKFEEDLNTGHLLNLNDKILEEFDISVGNFLKSKDYSDELSKSWKL